MTTPSQARSPWRRWRLHWSRLREHRPSPILLAWTATLGWIEAARRLLYAGDSAGPAQFVLASTLAGVAWWWTIRAGRVRD